MDIETRRKTDIMLKVLKLCHHEQYPFLLNEIEKHTTDNLSKIYHDDFLDRLWAMPLPYIEEWLDQKHDLSWNPIHYNRLLALRGGFLDVFQKHPTANICKVNSDYVTLYKNTGYRVARSDDQYSVVYKESNFYN